MPTTLINGKTCFYQDVGEGYPILLGHSYMWTSNMWDPQLKSLTDKGFRCIAPDLWDHGKSGHLNANHITMAQLADDAWQLMKQLKIPEFAMIGLSVGGMWGAELAFRHPDAVKGLVLMDTFLGKEPDVTKKKYFGLLDILENEKRFTDPLLNQIVPLFFSPFTLSQKPKIVDHFRHALANIKEGSIPGIVTLGKAIFSRNCSLDKLAQVNQPTLFLVGKDDIPRPPRESQEMASRTPNAEMHVIEHGGHICNLEQPEQVDRFLLSFLKKNIFAKKGPLMGLALSNQQG